MSVPVHSRRRTPGAVDAAALTGLGPPFFSNCVCWLDGSQLTGYADGNSVSTFPDLSGNNNPYTAGTAPVYRAASGSTLAGLEFNGSSQYLAAAGRVLPLTDFSLYLVLKPLTGNSGRAVGWENTGSGSNGVALINNAGNTDFLVLRNSGSSGDISGLGTTSDNRYVYSIRMGSGGTANSIARVNGVQKGTGTLTAWTSSGETAHLGSAGNTASFWKGVAYELVIYNTKLSETDNGTVETYLNGKHAIY